MKPTTLLSAKSRTGKIGRLPRTIRNELNQRLDNGQPAAPILAWLNALPEVQAALATYFDATPITKQNLAQWHQGGFQEWLQHQEFRDLVSDFADESQELTGEDRPMPAAGYVSTLLVAQLALAARKATLQLTDPVELCQRLQELLLTLCRVRHQDYLAGRLYIDRERFETDYPHQEEPAPTPSKSLPSKPVPPTPERGRPVRSNDDTSPISAPPQASYLTQPFPAPFPPTSIQPSPTESNPDDSSITSDPADACKSYIVNPPRIPDPDPKKEAYNRWFNMNHGSEPFDYDVLQKLYAAIPKQENPGMDTDH